jgi:hypothetical protein
VRREDIFEPTIGSETLHGTSNGNGMAVVKFTIMLTHSNIHKSNWTSLDGKTQKPTDYVLIDKRHNQIYLMSDLLEGLTVILTAIWWLKEVWRGYQ